MKSAPAIAFEYQPSRWLAGATVAIGVLALLAVAGSGFGVWTKLVLAVATAAYTWYKLRSFLRPAAQRVAWYEAGHWRAQSDDGEEHVAELRHAVVVGRLIVLSVRIGQRAVSLPLLPDNCSADLHRRLRVRLARADTVVDA